LRALETRKISLWQFGKGKQRGLSDSKEKRVNKNKAAMEGAIRNVPTWGGKIMSKLMRVKTWGVKTRSYI